eukprot:1138913-Pelagomonas_calceolata.AAC.8
MDGGRKQPSSRCTTLPVRRRHTGNRDAWLYICRCEGTVGVPDSRPGPVAVCLQWTDEGDGAGVAAPAECELFATKPEQPLACD